VGIVSGAAETSAKAPLPRQHAAARTVRRALA
jgi:hypothetical protein